MVVEKKILKVFTKYGQGGNFSQITRLICISFHSHSFISFLRNLISNAGERVILHTSRKRPYFLFYLVSCSPNIWLFIARVFRSLVYNRFKVQITIYICVCVWGGGGAGGGGSIATEDTDSVKSKEFLLDPI